MNAPRTIAIAFGIVLALGLALFLAPLARAGEQPFHVAVAANGLWLEGTGPNFPTSLEAGGTAWASLTPHLTVNAGTFFGLSHSYVRWQAEPRLTISDADNPNINAYLGVRLRGASTTDFGPTEWALAAGAGWRPFPNKGLTTSPWDNFTLGVDGAVGHTSNLFVATICARYEIPLKR